MMNARTRLAALALSLAALNAHAGRPCDQQRPKAQALQQGLELAARTAKALDASGARVVVIARAGQDLSKYGLRYSHLGLAYRDDGARAWRVVHKLNECNTDRAALYRQGLAEFFNDSPHRYEAAIVILSADAQARLLPRLQDNQGVARLHTPRYSMLAYPWAQQYQQSNQWALETLADILGAGNGSRAFAQAWLRERGYEPTQLRLNTLERAGARLTRANIEFDDHPPELRFSGRIRTVTVDSVFAWMNAAGLAERTLEVR